MEVTENGVAEYLRLIALLCEFAYACGEEAARDGLPRIPFGRVPIADPQVELAWEAGWDDHEKEAAHRERVSGGGRREGKR
jgi:hypothetical protein